MLKNTIEKHQSLGIQKCLFKPVFPSIDTPVENVNRYSFPRIQWLKSYGIQITMSPMASPGGGEQWARHYKCSLQIWVLRHTLSSELNQGLLRGTRTSSTKDSAYLILSVWNSFNLSLC